MMRLMSYLRSDRMKVSEKVTEEELKELEDFWEQLQLDLD